MQKTLKSDGSITKLYRTSPCWFCKGDHWNDRCEKHSTSEARKLIVYLQGRCFICLLKGHRAFECISRNSCFYCKRYRHHHRSLCPHKFGNNGPEIDHECHTAKDISKIHATHSNQESDYAMAIQELQPTKPQLTECLNENAALKAKISKLENENETLRAYQVQCKEETNQRNTEIRYLKERIEKLEQSGTNFARRSFAGTQDVEARLKSGIHEYGKLANRKLQGNILTELFRMLVTALQMDDMEINQPLDTIENEKTKG